MIRRCEAADFETLFTVVNDGARAYAGVIPADCFHTPYMSREDLALEISLAVRFWGFEQSGLLVGVMGIQTVKDVTLIRHAYVRSASQGQGIGSFLLASLLQLTTSPVLIGAWADALWAVRFYQQRGFQLVSPGEKQRLLETYWTVSPRQIETSVVLADQRWRDQREAAETVSQLS